MNVRLIGIPTQKPKLQPCPSRYGRPTADPSAAKGRELGPRRLGSCELQLLTLPGGPRAVPNAAFRIPSSPTYPDSLHCGLGRALPSDPPRPAPANNFKQRGAARWAFRVLADPPASLGRHPSSPPPSPARPRRTSEGDGGRAGSSKRRAQREPSPHPFPIPSLRVIPLHQP